MTTRNATKPHITIASPCYNEEAVIVVFIKALQQVGNELESNGYITTFLLIDDGSTDRTLEIVNQAADSDSRIQVASFSRNFGHQAAVAAAIDLADSDALIIMDSDMQHPPGHIFEMIEAWQAGYNIVSMVREQTIAQTFVKKVTSRVFYRLFNGLSDTKVPDGAAEFLLLSKRSQTALKELPEYHQFWRGMISWIGFSRKYIKYTAAERELGTSKYSAAKMFGLAIDGMTSFSTRPMKVITAIGLVTATSGALYLIYILSVALFTKDAVQGWSSVIATIIILGGIQILITGVIGSYTAKIFEQVKFRPKYILSDPKPKARSERGV